MKKAIIILFSFICLTLQATYKEKNYLEKNINQLELKQYLSAFQKWVKYPAYKNREGWNKIIGDRKSDLIKQGKKHLKYEG